MPPPPILSVFADIVVGPTARMTITAPLNVGPSPPRNANMARPGGGGTGKWCFILVPIATYCVVYSYRIWGSTPQRSPHKLTVENKGNLASAQGEAKKKGDEEMGCAGQRGD